MDCPPNSDLAMGGVFLRLGSTVTLFAISSFQHCVFDVFVSVYLRMSVFEKVNLAITALSKTNHLFLHAHYSFQNRII